jgi:hypothetical protein
VQICVVAKSPLYVGPVGSDLREIAVMQPHGRPDGYCPEAPHGLRRCGCNPRLALRQPRGAIWLAANLV